MGNGTYTVRRVPFGKTSFAPVAGNVSGWLFGNRGRQRCLYEVWWFEQKWLSNQDMAQGEGGDILAVLDQDEREHHIIRWDSKEYVLARSARICRG